MRRLAIVSGLIGGLLCVTAAAQPKLTRTLFITGIEPLWEGQRARGIELRVSGRGVFRPTLQRAAEQGKVSKRRWLRVEEPLLNGGAGHGRFELGGQRFEVTHALPGVREGSYLIRAQPVGQAASVATLHRRIRELLIRDEHGGLTQVTRRVSRAQYLWDRYRVPKDNLQLLRRKLLAEGDKTQQRWRRLIASPSTPSALRRLARGFLARQGAKRRVEREVAQLASKPVVSVTRRFELREIDPLSYRPSK